MNYYYLSSPALLDMWLGNTAGNIREAFQDASHKTPVLLFIDEIDALGAPRGTGLSPGTGHREYNNITIQLLQSIDQYRDTPGLVLMAATNDLDSLDNAVVREGRFDAQIRVDMPNEVDRRLIFEAQLKRKPWNPSDVTEFSLRTPGASAAKIKGIVDRAAAIAALEGRRVEHRDLQRALDETGGKDRPLFQPIDWRDIILEPDVEHELQTLVRQLNASWSNVKILTTPSGVLLTGPPGTGKTMIGRLLATQSRRSFYPLSAADILGGPVDLRSRSYRKRLRERRKIVHPSSSSTRLMGSSLATMEYLLRTTFNW